MMISKTNLYNLPRHIRFLVLKVLCFLQHKLRNPETIIQYPTKYLNGERSDEIDKEKEP